eukprot:361845-Chlamydomonas_euryale.AAC.5
MISYRKAETGEVTPQHEHADRTAVILAKLLVEAGFSVFFDVEDLHGGGDWLQDLTEAVRGCVAFVPILSETYGDPDKSQFTYAEFKMAHQERKVIIPVFHSGRWPPKSLELLMTSLQYVPKSGAMTGRSKCTPSKVAVELVAALKKAGVHPSSAAPEASAVAEANPGMAQFEWASLVHITPKGKQELQAAGLTPAAGRLLQEVGYTEPGDLHHLGEQIHSICAKLPLIQASKLKQLANIKTAIPLGASAPSEELIKANNSKAERLLRAVIGLLPAKASEELRWLSDDVFAAVKQQAGNPNRQEVQQLCDWHGGIRGLVATMKPGASEYDRAHGQAAWALRNLACGSKDLMARIASAGAIEVLVALLKPGAG